MSHHPLAWTVGSAVGWVGSWSPGIGDPSLGGWVTVAAYVVATFLCWHVLGRRLGSNERRVWRVMCATLALLGINKQLDLQSALTEAGRIVFRALNLYEQRATAQLALMVAVAVAALAASVWLLRLAPGTPRATRLSILGYLSIVCFVGIRAGSFHHVDRWIGFDVGGLRLNWLLELGGIALLCAGAWRRTQVS
jgi:hypothetical protein